MADKGNLGTSPYSKMLLDNTAEVAADTPYQVSFVGDPQTGLYRKGTNSFSFGANGVEVANVGGNGTGTATFTVSQYFATGVATNLTATGTSILGALGLTNSMNFIGLATSSSGCILPAVSVCGIGAEITIFNQSATNNIKVFGAASDTVDGQTAATGVTLSVGKRATFFAQAAATWVSAQLGVVSA